MRPIVLSICVFAAACGGQGVDLATSPTSATAALAQYDARGTVQTQAQHGSAPFKGSFTGESRGVVNCPPTCPPTALTVSGTDEGTATHLGRFAAAFVDVVDLATQTSTGTIEFTAANGDRLFATTAGGQDAFTPPNISHVTLVATIIGGTGRFAGATGLFTIEFAQTIDLANGTASSSGSFVGHINLNS